jgi:hypothetical protein
VSIWAACALRFKLSTGELRFNDVAEEARKLVAFGFSEQDAATSAVKDDLFASAGHAYRARWTNSFKA